MVKKNEILDNMDGTGDHKLKYHRDQKDKNLRRI